MLSVVRTKSCGRTTAVHLGKKEAVLHGETGIVTSKRAITLTMVMHDNGVHVQLLKIPAYVASE